MLSRRARTENSAYDFAAEDDVQVAAYWYLWPTTSVWLVPGSANLFVLAMMPLDHENTVFSGHRYALDDTTDDARAQYLSETLGPERSGSVRVGAARAQIEVLQPGTFHGGPAALRDGGAWRPLFPSTGHGGAGGELVSQPDKQARARGLVERALVNPF